MDSNKIEWKKIERCDICDKLGFVRENIDNQGRNIMDTCFYGCADSRNIPTPHNSVCEYCCENKGTEAVYAKRGKWPGYYCQRCKDYFDEIIKEAEEEDEIAMTKWEEDPKEQITTEIDDSKTTVLFFDLPAMYSSHAKYLKSKYEFESQKDTPLQDRSYLIVSE